MRTPPVNNKPARPAGPPAQPPAPSLQLAGDAAVISAAGRQALSGLAAAESLAWMGGILGQFIPGSAGTRSPGDSQKSAVLPAQIVAASPQTAGPPLPSRPLVLNGAIPFPGPSQPVAGQGEPNPVGSAAPDGPWPAPETDIADQVDTENFPPPPKGLLTDPVGKPLPPFSNPLSQLATKGNQIVDANGKPVRLRGVNLSGLEYSPYGSAELQNTDLTHLFAGLVKLGVNVVRVPFNQQWASWPGYLQRLDKIAAAANSNGIYTIFDMHWANTDQTGNNQAQVKCLTPAMLQTWRQLAAHWANQTGILLDIHNEPEGISWKTYAPWAQAAVDNIHAINPKALVMVEGTQWGSDLSQVMAHPLNGTNIVYSTHEYGPSYGPANAGPQLWDQLFGKVAHKYPVFVGEFGGNDADLNYGKQLISYMDTRGLSWCAWDWGESVPQLEQNGNLTQFGQLVANSLKSN